MIKNKNNVGILGYGEVGRAIAKFFKSPRLRRRFHPPKQNFCGGRVGGQAKIKDLKRDDGLKGIEVLHVCIPYSKDFVKIVKKEIKEIKPKLTIIHSTIAPGTTKKIGGMTVHSPIRGIHPHLYKGVKIFIKYIGADSKRAAGLAKKHLESLGIKTKIFYPSQTTELGKLLDTSYYGLCIAWHGEMKKMCDKLGVDFDKVVTDFNQTYNKGYTKLKKKNVIRPVLYSPNPCIKGHCIISNAEILKGFFKNETFDLILKYKSKKK